METIGLEFMEYADVLLAGIGLLGTVFVTLRYLSNVNAKREEKLLTHITEREDKMFEHLQKKNEQIERITDGFTAVSKDMADAVARLSTRVEILDVEIKNIQASKK